MNQDTLDQFRKAVTFILNGTPVFAKGGRNVLDTMEQIQAFYKTSHDAILALIEATLTQDSSYSTPQLLAELDHIVNDYFGLDKNIDMTDSMYEH